MTSIYLDSTRLYAAIDNYKYRAIISKSALLFALDGQIDSLLECDGWTLMDQDFPSYCYLLVSKRISASRPRFNQIGVSLAHEILKTLKSGILSNRLYEYNNREAGNLPRFGAKDFIAGIELEIISDAGVVLYKPSYCRVKRDGSLSEGGVEIVTRPDSIDSHVRNLGRMFSINHKKYKLKVNETCGMHVHVPHTHARAWALKRRIYNNILRYQRIAGRQSNEYCRYADNGERYQAVNVADDTIEFRLFSGTLSLHRIKRRLQWIEAICRWSMKQPGRQPRATDIPQAEPRVRSRRVRWRPTIPDAPADLNPLYPLTAGGAMSHETSVETYRSFLHQQADMGTMPPGSLSSMPYDALHLRQLQNFNNYNVLYSADSLT